MKTIKTLLVANRGEIASRIFSTARRMGLGTVAVFSDADEHLPFVRHADVAVRIGPAPSAQSYLNAAALLRAATLTGADAVHPGYGFLSENAAFAQAVLAAGLTFVGPSPKSIAAMGTKREAKRLAVAHGLSVVPGFEGGDQSTTALSEQAMALTLPVIFKPSAGGGGKGMHVVHRAEELVVAIESAKREALRAFGDATLIGEKYLARPRHIEIQILADAHGNVTHLFERECSVQRRHQKVIEEAPAFTLSPKLRAAMSEAALTIARAISYVGAGTVEFLLDENENFYFCEMNTRLQVEHRVTERITGIDLVEEQIRLAQGEVLRVSASTLTPQGHAIECRLYAERPEAGFLPAAGEVLHLTLPRRPDTLIDCSIEAGSAVSTHYDPMLAKIVAHGATRELAIAELRASLRELTLLGVDHNGAFLEAVVSHPDFETNQVHIHWLESAAPRPPAQPSSLLLPSLALVVLHSRASSAHTAPSRPVVPHFRNNAFADAFVEIAQGDLRFRVQYQVCDSRTLSIRVAEQAQRFTFLRIDEERWSIEDALGLKRTAVVAVTNETYFVSLAGYTSTLRLLPRFQSSQSQQQAGGLIAPMPGKVISVHVSAGTQVTKGQTLMVLESMKMEQRIVAPKEGTVSQVAAREGAQVTAGQVLIRFGDDA
jgi:acetyl/propionyl-CoA carboxylase alpha subunit